MRYSILLLFLLHCFPALVSGQNDINISGTVTSKSVGAIPYASVLLLKKPDSTLIIGTLSDSAGFFKIKATPGEYLVQVSFQGYEDFFTSLHVGSHDSLISVPNILLTAGAKILNEVVVSSKKPFLEQKIDRLIVNMANSITGAGYTAFEVLQKVPGVVIINDHITLSGKSGVIILLNGKSSPYIDLESVIKSIPGSNIDHVEVMNNPGAKFDASGNAGVINIVLKKNKAAGFNANITTGGGFSIYDQSDVKSKDRKYQRITSSIGLNYRAGNWNIFGNVDQMHRSVFEVNNYDRIINNDLYKQTNYYPYSYNMYNFRFGVDYAISKRTIIGFLLNGFHRNGDGTGITYTDVFKSGSISPMDNFLTNNYTNINRTNITGNLNLNHRFDSSGTVLNIDFDFSTYYYHNKANIDVFSENGNETNLFQEGKMPLKYWTLRADYEHPFKKFLKLETGFKISNVGITNDLLFIRNREIDSDLSNIFKYNEAIYAGYTTLTGGKTKFNWQLGLRAESTGNNGYLKDSMTLKRNYLQLFPSFFLQYQVRSGLSLNFNYGRRTDRPDFQLLSPFSYFIDSLTYAQGNPTLLPQLTHLARLTINRRSWPTLAISYGYTNRVIYKEAPHQIGKMAYMYAENLGNLIAKTVELNYPIQIGNKITGYSGVQAFHNTYKTTFSDSVYNRSKFNWQVYGGITYKFSKSFSAEVNAYFSSGQLNEFWEVGSSSGVNIGLQQNILKGKGKINLAVNDIFYKNGTISRINYGAINMVYLYRDDSRNARLTFSYSLGKHQLKKSRERQVGSKDEQQRL